MIRKTAIVGVVATLVGALVLAALIARAATGG